MNLTFLSIILMVLGVCASFSDLLAIADEPLTLAREFAQHISDGNLPRVARLLVHASDRNSSSAAFGTLISRDGDSPSTLLLRGWGDAIDHNWPAPVEHGAVFDAAIERGVNGTGRACAIVTAIRTRNVHATLALLRGADAREVRACALDPAAHIFYNAAATPTPGTARLFFRGGRNGIVKDGAPAYALRDASGVMFDPRLWPAASKLALEAASPPVELDLLAPFLAPGFDGAASAEPDWLVDESATHAGRDDDHEVGPESPPLLPRAWVPSPMAADALLDREPRSGHTPILRACESGRSAVLRRLLAILPLDATPESDALKGTEAARGATCAHLAAAAGHVAVIAALIERFPRARSDSLLGSRDSEGRTPCEIAERLGGFLAPAAAALRSAGACTQLPAPQLPVGCPHVPRIGADALPPNHNHDSGVTPQMLRDSLKPRGFSALAHFAAGWRSLSPDALAALSLPADLLFAFDGPSGAGAESGVSSADSGPALAFACMPPEITPDILGNEEILNRDYLSTHVPFIVRGAYDPITLESSEPDARPPFEPPSIDFLSKMFRDVVVDIGALPYANAYGAHGARMPVDEFIATYMGSAANSRDERMQSTAFKSGAESEARIVATLSSRKSAGAYYSGPASDLSRPPYIFDASIMKAESMKQIFANFSLPRAFQKGRATEQFIMGPPLSGAMPHFHGSAVNVLAVGVKLWVLVPPAGAAFVDAHAAKWFRDDYLEAHKQSAEGDGTDYGMGGKGGWHFIFTQAPGDLVYVP
jgi:hypothetical protein